MLQLDWVQCHEEACRLEHSISDDVANRIQKKLDAPKTCPHGNPIPDENGYIAPSKNDSLSNLGNGEQATVAMVPDESTEVLRYLSTLGMIPGAKIVVEEKAPFKGPMLVKVGASSYPISLDVASSIFVTREK
jgi:DtxR family Mn-dependent transcriptional regulator